MHWHVHLGVSLHFDMIIAETRLLGFVNGAVDWAGQGSLIDDWMHEELLKRWTSAKQIDINIVKADLLQLSAESQSLFPSPGGEESAVECFIVLTSGVYVFGGRVVTPIKSRLSTITR